MGWQPVLKSVPRSVPRRSFLEEGLAEIAAAVEDIAAYYAPLYTGGPLKDWLQFWQSFCVSALDDVLDCAAVISVLENTLRSLREAGYTVREKRWDKPVWGRTYTAGGETPGKIFLSADLKPAAKLAVLFHEAAHVVGKTGSEVVAEAAGCLALLQCGIPLTDAENVTIKAFADCCLKKSVHPCVLSSAVYILWRYGSNAPRMLKRFRPRILETAEAIIQMLQVQQNSR